MNAGSFALDGQVALVTGAAGGLGRATALAMASAGADVWLTDIGDPAPLRELTELITQKGRRAGWSMADLSDERQVITMVEEVTAGAGRIDSLVNNAGISEEAPILELSVDSWDRMMAVNLRSVFLCSRAVLPGMIDQGSGTIINIASQAAVRGAPRLSHYAASKAGILGFTRSISREVGPLGIRVNAIAPGPMRTPLIEPRATPDWIRAKLSSQVLVRLGEPDEVAATVVFLASPASSFYVGQTLQPNGGGVV
jgi:3-oxoacyl-[acyl-carrier protein] reductase